MPRVNIPLTDIDRAGSANVGTAGTEVTGDPSNNHDAIAGDGVIVLVRNSSGTTARVVTEVIQDQIDGQAVTNRTVSVPANGHKIIGPFSQEYLVKSGADKGKIYLNADNADLRFQAFKLPR